jgi:hypothetical protein
LAAKGIRPGKAMEGVVMAISVIEQPSQREACFHSKLQGTIGVIH